MKIKKLLFLSLFLIIGLFLFMPNSVNATDELNKMKIEMADPNEGEKIPSYAKVILSNDTSELVYENIELSWEKNDLEINITDNTLFEKNTKYNFDISEDSLDFIYKDCEDKGYLFTRATELYVNGVLIENEQMSFYDQVVWISGVETVNIEVEDLIVGKPLPSTLKYVIKTSTETKEIVVNCDWVLGDMQTQVDENALAKLEEEYIPMIKSSSNPNMEEFEELATKTDFRTKMYINGELINYANGLPTLKAKNEVPKFTVTFDANGGVFSSGTTFFEFENWNNDEYNYDSIIKPTRDGYTFKGYYTEKTGGTTLQLLMAEVGVDKDMTFYARWEQTSIVTPPVKDDEFVMPDDDDENAGNTDTGNAGAGNTNTDNTNTNNINTGVNNNNTSTEKNPQTGDNIVLFIIILGVSIMGVTTTTRIRKNLKNN